MSKGIIRKVDELGRIVIPVEIRNKLNIQDQLWKVNRKIKYFFKIFDRKKVNVNKRF